jgi:hypothetical protein
MSWTKDRVCLIVLSLFSLATAFGQVPKSSVAPKKNAPLKTPSEPALPGVVSGRVFAITAGGDLKPARLARVYLFHLSKYTTDGPIPVAEDEYKNSAAMEWLKENLTAAQERLKLQKERTKAAEESLRSTKAGLPTQSRSEVSECLEDLQTYDLAVMGTLKWGEENQKESDIWITNADEEGVFKITDVPHGTYILLARGRAGFNEAFWKVGVGNLAVESGMETTVKLSDPEKACLALN